jgi:hypothetical protein
MSSVLRKHPFTSLFSPKMSRWCRLSASDRAGPAGLRARLHGLLADIAGCIRDMAGCAGQHGRCRAMCSARLQNVQGAIKPGDYREFADSGPWAVTLFAAIPVSGVADDAGALWNA